MSIFRDIHDFHARMRIRGPHQGGPVRELGGRVAGVQRWARMLRGASEEFRSQASLGLEAAGRFAWLFEELAEVLEAHARGDLGGEVQERLDLIYFLGGDLDLMNIPPERADAMWAELHRANMAKAPQANGAGHHVKITKPAGWQPPRIDAMVRAIGE